MKYTAEDLDKVFKAYDIRGLTETQLDDEFYYNLGKAFVTFLKAKNIAVGFDIRNESIRYSKQFIKGATECGCNVFRIGEIATEMLYFAVGSDTKLDGGVSITASHNPAGWNGCKMVGKDATAISEVSGLKEIENIMISGEYMNSSEIGKVEDKDIYPSFKEKILSNLEGIGVNPMKIVVDAGNGIGGKVFDYVFEDLNLDLTKLYFEPDGRFPHHSPDPVKEENVKDLKAKVLELKADLGIAIDGDADRVFFIDSRGRHPEGTFTAAIFAKHFVKKNKGAKIIHDVRVIWPIVKEVEKLGGAPIACRAGHSFFKEKMREEDAVFGAEFTSHFYYKNYYYADSGMTSIAIMFKLLSQGMNFEKELDYLYANYHNSGEVNYKSDNQEKVIETIRSEYSDGKLSEIDGISIEYPDWRFNLRSSSTENVLRLNVEALSEELLKEKFLILEKHINGIRQNKPSNPALL